MAPEVFRHEAYDKSIDVYAFGIIVHEVREGGIEQESEVVKHAN